MARRTADITRKEIIQVATQKFLELGYSNTSAKAISEEVGISTGNLTFHYPTKEHLLAKLTEMLCDFQWKMMDVVADEGETSLFAVCIELAAMASICEEDAIAKDFYLSSYMHTMSLDLIRKSDCKRAQMVFAEYCSDWTTEQYQVAEIMVSGVEYATLMCTDETSLEDRIQGALNAIMLIYNVPEERRKHKIEKVMAMDYRDLGRRILQDFKEYTIWKV